MPAVQNLLWQPLRQIRLVEGKSPDTIVRVSFYPLGKPIPAFYADSALAEAKKRFPHFPLIAVEPVYGNNA